VKKYSSLLLILFVSCSGSNQVDEESIAEDFISTTTQFNGITTTTIKIEETTTTTANIITEEIISDIKLEILNCPSEKVEIAIGESYKVEFSVQAGDADITSIFYYFELNGEYYSRLPLDKENHSEYFDFPTANDITYSATWVEKLAEGDSYLVSIDVSDEDSFFSYDLCKVDF
jgi:hypothetical protein